MCALCTPYLSGNNPQGYGVHPGYAGHTVSLQFSKSVADLQSARQTKQNRQPVFTRAAGFLLPVEPLLCCMGLRCYGVPVT